jgi:ribosomal protein S18 acetylase RimI-like enzyme
MALATPGKYGLEILDLRHFTSSDLRPVLDEESRLWARLLSWDYSGSADMILRYVDAKILPGYAAVSGGRIFGYSFFVYEGSKGVIGDLYVSDKQGWRPSDDDHYVEQRLITHVIETLQQSPGVHRVEAQLLVHDTGTVAEPFERMGFQRYPRLFMVLPITGPSAPPPAPVNVPPGIEIRRWNEQDYQAAASVITGAYSGHVDARINDQYCSVSGSLRFLNNIVRFPGCGQFDNSSSFLALDRRTRNAVGLILCSRVKEDVGHVTQVCVLPEYRGRGIGEVLLHATANDLARRRFRNLTLTVTEANSGAANLYKRLGYDIHRVFDAFVWEA